MFQPLLHSMKISIATAVAVLDPEAKVTSLVYEYDILRNTRCLDFLVETKNTSTWENNCRKIFKQEEILETKIFQQIYGKCIRIRAVFKELGS